MAHVVIEIFLKIMKEPRTLVRGAPPDMVIEALRAAEELEKGGYDIEVIDPRTLRPLDTVKDLIPSQQKSPGLNPGMNVLLLGEGAL